MEIDRVKTESNEKIMRKLILSLALLVCWTAACAAQTISSEDNTTATVTEAVQPEAVAEDATDAAKPELSPGSKKIYVFPIREDIMPSVTRLTYNCLNEAREMGADYIIINMNTYGGLVNAADSIRTMLINCEIPVFTFINNQAASAGALISLATDSIYMRSGGTIGAATVVDQSGSEVPDKYQSFMRAMMRSTAESHGKVPVVGPKGDTTWVWRRNPDIAQAMVDPSIVVEGISEEGKVLTLTTDEAINVGFCEGKAATIEEVLQLAGIDDYTITEYKPTGMDKLMNFLMHPIFQSILIMLIIGGIYFELQTPGIGFALVVAIISAVLYFAPLYVEGLADNWELAVFIIGVVLIVLEIFVTPGFGVLGILGVIGVITGLSFALIDSELLKYVPSGEISMSIVLRPFAMVIGSITAAFFLSLWLGKKFLTGESRLRRRIVLVENMTPEEGYISRADLSTLNGMRGVTAVALRPAGKIMIDGRLYEAAGADGAFIEKNRTVTVVREEGGVLYCREV